MTNPTTIEGCFEPVKLWQTKNGDVFTDETLANYRARKNGDSDPSTCGYPKGPSKVYDGFRRISDGALFIITPVSVSDEAARADVAEDRRYLDNLG